MEGEEGTDVVTVRVVRAVVDDDDDPGEIGDVDLDEVEEGADSGCDVVGLVELD